MSLSSMSPDESEARQWCKINDLEYAGHTVHDDGTIEIFTTERLSAPLKFITLECEFGEVT